MLQIIPRKILDDKYRLPMILIAVCLGALIASIPEVMASSFLPLPSVQDLDVPAPTGDTAVEKFQNLLGPLGRSVRIIVGAFAVLLLVISGFTMVLAGDNEEAITNQKKSITYGVIGLLMISIAGPLAEVFDFRSGNIIADDGLLVERVALFNNTTQLIITFVKYLLGSLAALMFIRSGATLVMSGANEESVTQEKKAMGMAAMGLLVVVFSDLIVRRILFDAKFNSKTSETVVAINQNEFVSQMIAITNIVVSFVGPIMVLGLIIGAVMYVTAGGDDEKTDRAKKIIINSVIGVAIIYGAFALVSTVITGVF